MRRSILLAAILAGMFIFVNAQTQDQPKPAKTPRITKKQVHQQERIKRGVKSGQLTKDETRKLEGEQAKIRNEKQAAKSDGNVTPQERRKIRHDQRKASRDIYRAKHNDQSAK
jgi:uncharacterized membrane protein YebE (DUF533 family)